MTRPNTVNVDITRMSANNAQQALSLICNEFASTSVLHRAVGVTAEEYREYIHASFEAMYKQGLSLVAIDRTNGDLVGCLVACDYVTQTQTSAEVPTKLQPVNALLQLLDKSYRECRQIQPGQCMLIDMAVVKSTTRGNGIYRTLREKAHEIGREAGYRWVVGELSSAATQHLCINRFGHKVCAEIEYASFSYRNKKPFAAIAVPPSIVLVEGAL